MERAEKKRENFSLRRINKETGKQDHQQTEQDLGLMELLGARWLSEYKASSFNLQSAPSSLSSAKQELKYWGKTPHK